MLSELHKFKGKISRALQTNKKYSFNSNRLCIYTKKNIVGLT